MALPRRRRRRSEGEGDGLEDDGDELDFRIASIEKELDKVTMAAAVQAQNNQVMQAQLEKLTREFDGPVEDEAFEELDELARKFEQFADEQREAQTVLAERLGKLIVRLDTVGGVGRLEDLPRLFEEALANRLTENLKILETNLEKRLANIEGGGPAQMAEISSGLEATVAQLREELDQVLRETQEELSVALSAAASQEQVQQLQGHLGMELDEMRREIEKTLTQFREQQKATEELEEVTRMVASRASKEELTEIKTAVENLQATVGESAGLGERAMDSLRKIEELAKKGDAWEKKLHELIESSSKSAKIVETHNQKVQLAAKLVTALEEKVRGIDAESIEVEEDDDVQIGFDLNDLLQVMTKHRASDLHLKVGQPPTVRLEGELIPVGNQTLSRGDCRRLVYSALGRRKREFLKNKDIEFAYEMTGARFLTNAFMERGNVSATFKMLSSEVPTMELMGLPGALQKLANAPKGLVLIVGPPASGKSMALASVINELNATRKIRVLSIEERIEYFHEDKMALVTQRELGSDMLTMAAGIRRGMRQDPDVMLVSTVADEECLRLAMQASERVLVIAGVNASGAEQAIFRLVGMFPEVEKKAQAKRLARTLRGSVGLRMLDSADGSSPIYATEVMVVNSPIAALIAEGNLTAINQHVAKGSDGMQTFDQSIARLRETGLVKADVGKPSGEQQGLAASGPPSGESGGPPSGGSPSAGSAPGSAGPSSSGPSSGGPPSGGKPQPPAPQAGKSGEGEPPPPMTEEDPIMNWL